MQSQAHHPDPTNYRIFRISRGRHIGPRRHPGVRNGIPLRTPPIRLDGQARSRVLLGSRHRGDSVWTQPERWPMHVYVCVANDDAAQNSDELTRDQVTNAAWGLLHESPERAAADEY